MYRSLGLTANQYSDAIHGDKKQIRRIMHERKVFAFASKITVSPNLEDNKRWCIEQVITWFIKELSYYLREVTKKMQESSE